MIGRTLFSLEQKYPVMHIGLSFFPWKLENNFFSGVNQTIYNHLEFPYCNDTTNCNKRLKIILSHFFYLRL